MRRTIRRRPPAKRKPPDPSSAPGTFRMNRIAKLCFAAAWMLAALPAVAQAPAPPPAYDPALAQKVGADARGMRKYVLVILKTGPTRVPDGPERDAMFAGHFA